MSIAKDSGGFKKLIKSAGLSQCAEEYLECMADPFTAETGCLPVSLTAIPSRKMKVFASGTLSTSSTNGNGFILVSPGLLVANDPGDMDVGAIRTTTASFTGTAFDTTTSLAVLAQNSNSDYVEADIGNSPDAGIQYRLVSCGIEVEATTPWSSRGGLVSGVCQPNHRALNGVNENELTNMDAAFREAVSSGGDSKFQLKYNGPIDPVELGYCAAISLLGGVSGTDPYPANRPIMGIWFSGPNSQTYMWRVVAHFEVIGYAARGKTITWADPKGAGLAQAVVAKAHNQSGANHHNSQTFWETLSHALHDGKKATSAGYEKMLQYGKAAVKFVEDMPSASTIFGEVESAAPMIAMAARSSRSAPRVRAKATRAAPRARPSTRRAAAPRRTRR